MLGKIKFESFPHTTHPCVRTCFKWSKWSGKS